MTTTIVSPPQTWTAVPEADRTVDETLCADAYLLPGLAEYARSLLQYAPATAWAPSTALDILALSRHSAVALRIRRRRTVALCALLVLAAAVPAVVAADLLGPVAALVVAVGLVSLWARRTHTVYKGRGRIHGSGRRVLVGLVVAPLALLSLALEPRLWIVAGAFLLAWVAVVAELLWARHRAWLVLGRAGKLRDLAPPLDPTIEERIGRLTTTNVVAYHSARAPTPFVGSGFLVRPWSINVDVRRGARDEHGEERAPEAVDVIALYEFLGKQFVVEAAVESGGVRRLNATFRLYVDGGHVPWSSDLLTGDPPRMHHELSWNELAARIRQLDGANHLRVYFCLEEVGRHGEIAVALFVRPYLRGGLLTVGLFPHVMPPLDRALETAVASLPHHPLDRLRQALRDGTRHTPALILASPAQCAGEVWRAVRLYRARRKWHRAARRRRPWDFGALISLREGVSVTDPKALSLVVMSDLSGTYNYLSSRVLGSVKAFLDQRGIDTRVLDGTADNVQNWNFGDVRADMISFGDHNTLRHGSERDDDDDRTE